MDSFFSFKWALKKSKSIRILNLEDDIDGGNRLDLFKPISIIDSLFHRHKDKKNEDLGIKIQDLGIKMKRVKKN